MNVVIKNGEAIMDLGDKAQYMDEFIRKVKSVVTIAELEITPAWDTCVTCSLRRPKSMSSNLSEHGPPSSASRK